MSTRPPAHLLANPLTAQGGALMAGLTHFDAEGHAHMVDVSDKPATDRVAVADGRRGDGRPKRWP